MNDNKESHWLRGALGRGLLWLVFLGPFFFLSYGYANQHAARVDAALGVASFHFAWERGVPLWTIIPYWSIDLLYGLAFLCCRDRAASLPAQTTYDGVPCLDLVSVRAAIQPGDDLVDAVQRLAALHGGKQEIWVACALGYSRSASVVAAWLCTEPEKTASVRDAVERVRRARPQVVLGADSLACLEAFRAGLLRQ
ncbi:MAG: dual specificity protein phosphatase family protein [Azoarcus sp.]|nr:dual specificity protein phosphatase family protein [Azoarcus sp.]